MSLEKVYLDLFRKTDSANYFLTEEDKMIWNAKMDRALRDEFLPKLLELGGAKTEKGVFFNNFEYRAFDDFDVDYVDKYIRPMTLAYLGIDTMSPNWIYRGDVHISEEESIEKLLEASVDKTLLKVKSVHDILYKEFPRDKVLDFMKQEKNYAIGEYFATELEYALPRLKEGANEFYKEGVDSDVEGIDEILTDSTIAPSKVSRAYIKMIDDCETVAISDKNSILVLPYLYNPKTDAIFTYDEVVSLASQMINFIYEIDYDDNETVVYHHDRIAFDEMSAYASSDYCGWNNLIPCGIYGREDFENVMSYEDCLDETIFEETLEHNYWIDPDDMREKGEKAIEETPLIEMLNENSSFKDAFKTDYKTAVFEDKTNDEDDGHDEVAL